MIESMLSWLGLGGSAIVVSLIIGALWLWRGVRIARIIGALLGSGVRIGIALFLFLAISIGMGWIELEIWMMIEDLLAFVRWMLDLPVDLLRSLIDR